MQQEPANRSEKKDGVQPGPHPRSRRGTTLVRCPNCDRLSFDPRLEECTASCETES